MHNKARWYHKRWCDKFRSFYGDENPQKNRFEILTRTVRVMPIAKFYQGFYVLARQ